MVISQVDIIMINKYTSKTWKGIPMPKEPVLATLERIHAQEQRKFQEMNLKQQQQAIAQQQRNRQRVQQEIQNG